MTVAFPAPAVRSVAAPAARGRACACRRAGAAPRPPIGGHGAPSGTGGASIVAVVNGDVISNADVDNRAPAVRAVHRPAAVARRARPADAADHPPADRRAAAPAGSAAPAHRRARQGHRRPRSARSRRATAWPPGTLRQRLAADGVAYRTLIDQMRVQIGWTPGAARRQLGAQAQITDADIDRAGSACMKQAGRAAGIPVGEIFIPVDDPCQAEDAQRFADTVIQQLRAGAPFPVVAAQFSQSQTALQGGDLGWVQAQPARSRRAARAAARCRRARSAIRSACPAGFAS